LNHSDDCARRRRSDQRVDRRRPTL